jgi:PilZ domain
MGQENRRSPRFPFIAVAEITHTDSGEQLDSRVAELSLNGCYVDMLNTLPVGSEIVIKIFAESECFEAPAKVKARGTLFRHHREVTIERGGLGYSAPGVGGSVKKQWSKQPPQAKAIFRNRLVSTKLLTGLIRLCTRSPFCPPAPMREGSSYDTCCGVENSSLA